MGLTKYNLGQLLKLEDERNSNGDFTLDDVKGISIQKIFIETKANMEGVSLNPYILVKPDFFAYVTVTSRNGEKITIAHNTTENTYIVSSSYVVFSVAKKDVLNSDYLFMYFNRPEFDRYARINSWGSARETFNWEDLCDIDIELPDLPTQQKYVDIYKAMIANQQAYERGLEDLKLVCDGYIEDLRRKMPCEKIGKYIIEENNKNTELQTVNVQGVNSTSTFGETRADTNGLDFHNYKIVKKNQFAYNPSRINLGSIALYTNDVDCIISPMYCVFSIIDANKLLPEYLMLWFGRKEFQRSTSFYAMGSVRDTFDFSLMKDVEIPIPDIKVQQSIADVYKVYIERKEINEKLKAQVKDICPILIKGSLEDQSMNTIKFHFDTQYATDLRDAVNDRQKQSIDVQHSEKGIDGDYFAWDRICAIMDRLEDTLNYLNSIELRKRTDNRAAYDFYDFLNNSFVVIECIKKIGSVFQLDENYIKEIEESNSVFGTSLCKKSKDGRYFEYIRSLCSVHPLCTNHQKEFLNGNKFHCCPFVSWNRGFSMNPDSELEAQVYSSTKGKSIFFIPLYISQFENYLNKWVNLIPEIIEAKNKYTDEKHKEYQKKKNKNSFRF